MTETTTLDSRSTVNDLVRRAPRALEVLHAFGIHTCCGGARTLVDAAREDGANLDALVAALAPVLGRV